MQVLLASQSPRRRALLQEAGIPLRLLQPGSEHEDRVPAGFSPAERALHLAREKALGAQLDGSDGLLLASDTVVALAGRCFSKPRDRQEAQSFLLELEGREHEVWTAIALAPVLGGVLDAQALRSEAHLARVRFRSFEPGELESYLDSGEWRDKAGGYGIQAAAGAFAALVSGELATVIGLPLTAVLAHWHGFQKEGELR